MGNGPGRQKNSGTCWSAIEILIESGVRREDRKKVIDKVAAVLILQSYLNSR